MIKQGKKLRVASGKEMGPEDTIPSYIGEINKCQWLFTVTNKGSLPWKGRKVTDGHMVVRAEGRTLNECVKYAIKDFGSDDERAAAGIY